MKKATRIFVNLLNDERVKSVEVKPMKFEYAKPNECFQNMMMFLDYHSDWTMHSGWLIGDYLGERGTAIIPHFWVVDAQRKHFDITPRNSKDTQTYEYVSDYNIAQFISKGVQLPVPLKLNSNGEFSALRKDGTFELVEKLDYGYLFSLSTQ